MVETGIHTLDLLLGGGYPTGSTILVVGDSGSAKEFIGYSFFQSGLKNHQQQENLCIYVTRLSVKEVLKDMRASGFASRSMQEEYSPSAEAATPTTSVTALWIASEGGQAKYDYSDLARLSMCIKEALKKNQGRKIRIIIDIISQLLMLNPPETVYRFLDQLFTEVKKYDSVFLATLEKEMHGIQVLSAMEQLFDGVLETSILPGPENTKDEMEVHGDHQRQQKVEIKKMRGVAIPSNSSIRIPLQALTTTTAMAAFQRQRIAILPFSNISPDPNDAYFADGMTEELILTLSKISGLKVIARTSVMGYKDKKEKKVDEIAWELKAGAVLEGSVRKAGDRLRITVQLIDSQTSDHLWSESYDRDLRDVFEIQSDIARRVASSLKILLLSDAEQTINRAYTRDAEAHILYLQGLSRLRQSSPADLQKSIDLLDLATKKDPYFALAHATLSEAYTYAAGDFLPVQSGFEKGMEHADKAIELDQTLADGHASRGIIRFQSGKWLEAEHDLRHAIELNSSHATAHVWYGYYKLVVEGNEDEALFENRLAEELDPRSFFIKWHKGIILLFARRYAEALMKLRESLALDDRNPGPHYWLGYAHILSGNLKEGVAQMRKGNELSGSQPYTLGPLGFALGVSGMEEEARVVIDNLKNAEKTMLYSPFMLALVHLGLGQKDEALNYLEKAYEEKDNRLYLNNPGLNPIFDPIRADPRLRVVLQKAGLAIR